MCFSGEMSAAFAVIGGLSAYWVYSRTSNMELASGIFFFFLMELLQAIQYYFIAPDLATEIEGGGGGTCDLSTPLPYVNERFPCDSSVNKLLTLLGFLHICLQPYFCHVINASLTKSCKYKDRYKMIKRLCLVGGFLLFGRYFLSYFPSLNKMNLQQQPSTEWLRGNYLCTFKSKSMWHLGWSVPMADPSYYVVGASIHSFLMFAPFLVLYEKKGMLLQGMFLFLFGPVTASFISDNLMEQASIWCFFSIAQISIMLFLIRETLLVNWSKDNISLFRGNAKEKKSGLKGDDQNVESVLEDFQCHDFINCEYCASEKNAYLARREKSVVKQS